ncbi:MAG: hypothetical protein Q8N21_02430 [bacterium]|nr:hypothetical protein [bacterium]
MKINFFAKKYFSFGLILLIVSGSFLFGHYAYAVDIGVSIAQILGHVISAIIYALGLILTTLFSILIWVCGYNGFIKSAAVANGWVIVRDLCNMFFILILLIIAFATILRRENYNAKKLLPKLLIMAVLINFSKTICGLIIDFAQVIMLTFVNGFAAMGESSLTTMLGINKILEIDPAANNVTGLTIFGSYMLALVYVIIALIVTIVMIAVLVMRMVMLWVYIVLSPLAFLMSAFPAGQKYASQWWSEFSKQVVVGPILAFFIWLSFVSATSSTGLVGDIKPTTATNPTAAITTAGSEDNMIKFIISIGMLIGGLMVTQQLGGAAGSMAGNAIAKIKATGIGAAKWTGRTAAYLPKEYAKRAGYGAADRLLDIGKEIPIISGLAIKKQGELRMKREFAEEKDTRYMKYLPEQDLDRVMRNYTGEGRTRAGQALSFATRGQEASRQGYKRALMEKMQRGEDWGHGAEASRRKTQAMIDLARMGGHSVTAEGEDSFRDADIGKLFQEFRNKHVGNIDNNLMRDYYGTVRGGRYTAGPHAGEHASEYFRENDIMDAAGNLIASAGPGMRDYTASRIKAPQAIDLHHTQFTPEVLNAMWGPDRSASKKMAALWDRGTAKQRSMLKTWATSQPEGFDGIFGNRGVLTPAQKAAGMSEDFGLVGRSRNVTGKSKSPEVASGITGLNKIDKGRLALNFSDIGLDNLDALYVEGKDKSEIAGRIRQSLSKVDENLAKSVEEQINSVNYLVLHNKEKEMSGIERRATHAHELLHGRMSSAVTDNELKQVWSNSMSETDREKARQKVKKVYENDKMSDDAIMHEYFTEGLTNKTRWAVKDPEKKITLDSKAEESLDNLLKSKGSNIHAFTSNVTETRPTKDDVKQTVAGAVDSKLQESMENLANAIESMGDGLDSINKVGGSLGDLEKSVYMNNINLEKNAKAYEDNSSKLDDLSNKIS